MATLPQCICTIRCNDTAPKRRNGTNAMIRQRCITETTRGTVNRRSVLFINGPTNVKSSKDRPVLVSDLTILVEFLSYYPHALLYGLYFVYSFTRKIRYCLFLSEYLLRSAQHFCGYCMRLCLQARLCNATLGKGSSRRLRERERYSGFKLTLFCFSSW